MNSCGRMVVDCMVGGGMVCVMILKIHYSSSQVLSALCPLCVGASTVHTCELLAAIIWLLVCRDLAVYPPVCSKMGCSSSLVSLFM